MAVKIVNTGINRKSPMEQFEMKIKHLSVDQYHVCPGTRKKVPYSFPVCGSSNAHAQLPIVTTDAVLSEASAKSLLQQQRL